MIKSQFTYCPLACMFCPTNSNNLVNKVQERTLKVNVQGQWQQLPNITKWKQWTPKKPAIFNEGNL